MKKSVIFDCDNTLGVLGKDVDDGLTLIYLLGCPDIELQAITLTYGNARLETVERVTHRLAKDLNIKVPIYSGDKAAEYLSTAKDVDVLATGSLTNLYHAAKIQPNFYSNINTLYIMGGITEPLYINNVQVNELNFASNPVASEHVLNSEANIYLLNGHTTGQALFGKKELERLRSYDGFVYKYIDKAIRYWVYFMQRVFDLHGFCNWDMAAAICITHKELFSNTKVFIQATLETLKTGDIGLSSKGKEIYMPDAIIDIDRFNEIIFQSIANFQDNFSKN